MRLFLLRGIGQSLCSLIITSVLFGTKLYIMWQGYADDPRQFLTYALDGPLKGSACIAARTSANLAFSDSGSTAASSSARDHLPKRMSIANNHYETIAIVNLPVSGLRGKIPVSERGTFLISSSVFLVFSHLCCECSHRRPSSVQSSNSLPCCCCSYFFFFLFFFLLWKDPSIYLGSQRAMTEEEDFTSSTILKCSLSGVPPSSKRNNIGKGETTRDCE